MSESKLTLVTVWVNEEQLKMLEASYEEAVSRREEGSMKKRFMVTLDLTEKEYETLRQFVMPMRDKRLYRKILRAMSTACARMTIAENREIEAMAKKLEG